MAWTPTNFIGWKQSLPPSSIVSAIASVVKIRAHLGVYVRGQLSDLPEKSVEPIALEAGVAPRTLQEFLSQLKWDEDRMRDRL